MPLLRAAWRAAKAAAELALPKRPGKSAEAVVGMPLRRHRRRGVTLRPRMKVPAGAAEGGSAVEAGAPAAQAVLLLETLRVSPRPLPRAHPSGVFQLEVEVGLKLNKGVAFCRGTWRRCQWPVPFAKAFTANSSAVSAREPPGRSRVASSTAFCSPTSSPSLLPLMPPCSPFGKRAASAEKEDWLAKSNPGSVALQKKRLALCSVAPSQDPMPPSPSKSLPTAPAVRPV